MTDAIIFIDALSPGELEGTLDELHQGNMDAGTPRVTPRVMSSIYTGLDPAENGMMDISRYGGERTTRPSKSTFIDQMLREGMSVLSMGMPFCVPFEESNPDSIVHGDSIGGEAEVQPQNAAALVVTPPPAADAVKGHPDSVFASYHDQTYTHFNTFKEAIRRVHPDVALLGYRLVDAYCHFQHTETRDGKPYRQHLIDDVAALVERVSKQIDGDVMFFSDHGQTELTDVFRVNRWLKEKGYLDYKVDYDFIDTMESHQNGEDHPVNHRVENQVTIGSPGVFVDEEASDVICADPFDSSLTLLTDPEDFDTDAFREDLLGTGMYRGVDYKWELYDEDADYYNTVPNILPDREEGVFVSGNLHKEPIGMGYYRTGVHDYTACFGSTRELNIPQPEGRDGMILPEQMHDVITDFIGLDVSTSPIQRQQMQQYTYDELELVQQSVNEAMQQ